MAEDLAGKKFGKLTVIKRVANSKKNIGWMCKCECGKTSVVYTSNLTSGNTKSCGCLKTKRSVTSGSHGKILWTDQELDDMYKIYINTKSSRQVAKKYNISKTTVLSILNKKNLVVPTRGRSKYVIDDSYFDRIDTPDKAYFFGLLMTDGSANRDKRYIRIQLQEDDKHILDSFKKYLNYSGPVTFADIKKRTGNPNNSNAYILEFGSRKIWQDLFDKGMVPNKSLVLKYPTCIPDKLQSHYLRGMIDGDGCIFYTLDKDRNNYHSYATSLIGTQEVCQRVKDLLEHSLNITVKYRKLSKHNTSNTYQLRVSGNRQAEIFLAWLYKDSNKTIRLARKYQKYLDFLDYRNSAISVDKRGRLLCH